MKTLKKTLKIAVDVLIVLIFVISVVVVLSGVQQRKSGVPGVFGYSVSIVLTDSMTGTFEVGDIVIGKMVGAETTISKDDIVMYKFVDDNLRMCFNTHRVKDVLTINGETVYETWGDKLYGTDTDNPYKKVDDGYRARKDIVSVYTGKKIPGVGKVITFIKTPPGFIITLVIPLTLFILYEAFQLVKLYMDKRKEEMVGAAQEQTSEAVKEAIIREYLARQVQSNENPPENKNGEGPEK